MGYIKIGGFEELWKYLSGNQAVLYNEYFFPLVFTGLIISLFISGWRIGNCVVFAYMNFYFLEFAESSKMEWSRANFLFRISWDILDGMGVSQISNQGVLFICLIQNGIVACQFSLYN